MKELSHILAIVLFTTALVFTGIGIYMMYAYDPYHVSTHIATGGDAPNHLILASRGIGWICAGIVLALVGNAFLIITLVLRLKPPSIEG